MVLGRRAAQLSECYPYGVFTRRDGVGAPRIGVRVAGGVVDLAMASAEAGSGYAGLLSHPSLDPVLAAGRSTWEGLATAVPGMARAAPVIPLGTVDLQLPFTVADYVDFYASEHHATNLGRILRPGQEPLPPGWRHQPMGYHGRAGTVVVSGTDVVRPRGHVRTAAGAELRRTARLDAEAEVGFIVGVPSVRGESVPLEAFADHVFGVVLVNDWSARDIQAWETVPLGPFLGKSFQTSVSPWVVPLSALGGARVWPGSRADATVSPYLAESEPWGLDIRMELVVNGQVVSRPPYRTMHWSPAQLLAHLTVNGAAVRTGDLFASGTVSGPGDDEVGSLVERWHGERFLSDGDVVTIRAVAPSTDGSVIDFGEVSGRVAGS
jgi:fumarylacetoacetase